MIRDIPPEPELVRFHDGYFDLLIYPNGNGYPIEHHRINTAPKLLGWIAHLCGKGNVTREHIRALIKAAQGLGVRVDWNA